MDTHFFSECTTVESVKKRYRELALQYHPDRNQDHDTTKIMQAINAQYHEALESCTGQTRTATGGQTYTYTYRYETEEEIRQTLADILAADLPKADVYLIGYWIWIDFPAKPDAATRNTLKNTFGCIWHAKRQKWYWRPDWMQSTYNSRKSFGDLAATYGYRHFTTKGRQEDDTEDQQQSLVHEG